MNMIDREDLTFYINELLCSYLIYDAFVDGEDARVEIDYEKTSNLMANALLNYLNKKN